MPTLTRADFDINGSGSAFFDSGSAALGFARTMAGVATAVCVQPSLAALPTQGYTHGYLQLAAGRLAPDFFSSGGECLGVACLLSAANYENSGTGYFLEHHPVNGQTNFGKMSTGLAGRTVLHTASGGSGDKTLGLVWLVDPYAANWVAFLIFVNGTLLFRYQDFFSPIVTGEYEGYFFDDGGSGNPFTFHYQAGSLQAVI